MAIQRLATISPHHAAPFIFRTVLLEALLALAALVALMRVANGSGSVIWLGLFLVLGLLSLRPLFGQVLVLYRGASPGRPALWEQNGRLVYLSPLYASLPVNQISGVERRMLWREFGRQDYAVIRTRGGRRMLVHLAVIGESFDHLKELVEELAPA